VTAPPTSFVDAARKPQAKGVPTSKSSRQTADVQINYLKGVIQKQ